MVGNRVVVDIGRSLDPAVQLFCAVRTQIPLRRIVVFQLPERCTLGAVDEVADAFRRALCQTVLFQFEVVHRVAAAAETCHLNQIAGQFRDFRHEIDNHVAQRGAVVWRGNGGGAFHPAGLAAGVQRAAALIAIRRAVFHQLDHGANGLAALAVRYQVDRVCGIPLRVQRQRVVVRIVVRVGGPAFAGRFLNLAVHGEFCGARRTVVRTATLDLIEQLYRAVPVGADRAHRCGVNLMAAVGGAHVRFDIVETTPVFEAGALQLVRAEAEKAVYQYHRQIVGRQRFAVGHQCRNSQRCAGPEFPADLQCEFHVLFSSDAALFLCLMASLLTVATHTCLESAGSFAHKMASFRGLAWRCRAFFRIIVLN